MVKFWPHQERARAELQPYIDRGDCAVALTSPTGGGKSLMQRTTIKDARARGFSVCLYTNRVMLRDQLSTGLTADGIDHGVIAAGYDDKADASQPVQLCMIPTIDSRMRRPAFELPLARVVLIDECHNDTGRRMQEIVVRHRQKGATVVGFTGTPVGIGHIYEHLIVAGVNSELRRCGAHVPVITYAPSEIDTRQVRKVRVGEEEYASDEYRQAVFGSVLEHYHRLNPNRTPTIIFAPGVKESRWIAEEMTRNGVRTAHIDGERIWLDGQDHPSTDDMRDFIKKCIAGGDIDAVSNRFVLREGIDIPELQHLIFATPFSSLTAYLQAGGRVLRSHPSHTRATVADHGGNWWRHGSLNSDREWDMGKTDADMVADRAERMRQQKRDDIPEPIVCEKCGAVRTHGPQCHSCKYMSKRSVRQIIQADGSLQAVRGDVFKPRRVSTDPAEVKAWKACYFRCKNAKTRMTFTQAGALFARENGGRWPDPSWPYMPKDAASIRRAIKDVPSTELNPVAREVALV